MERPLQEENADYDSLVSMITKLKHKHHDEKNDLIKTIESENMSSTTKIAVLEDKLENVEQQLAAKIKENESLRNVNDSLNEKLWKMEEKLEKKEMKYLSCYEDKVRMQKIIDKITSTETKIVQENKSKKNEESSAEDFFAHLKSYAKKKGIEDRNLSYKDVKGTKCEISLLKWLDNNINGDFPYYPDIKKQLTVQEKSFRHNYYCLQKRKQIKKSDSDSE